MRSALVVFGPPGPMYIILPGWQRVNEEQFGKRNFFFMCDIFVFDISLTSAKGQ